jgi:hypothetical protein
MKRTLFEKRNKWRKGATGRKKKKNDQKNAVLTKAMDYAGSGRRKSRTEKG